MEAPHDAPQTPEAISERRLIGQNEKLKERIAYLEKLVKDGSTADEHEAEFFDTLKAALEVRADLPPPKARARKIGRVPTEALFHISDVHYGEVVRASSTGGLAQYSPQIAHERVWEATSQVIDLGREMRLDKLVVLEGGDMISGTIHDDIERSNAEMIVQQTLDMSDITVEMLERFAGAFPSVEVDGRSGNHGRPYRPMFFNRKQVENWDYVLYKTQEFRLANSKRIKFLTNESFWNVIEAGNRKFLTMHGDTIKHANSMSLPWYSMFKELLKFMAMRDEGGVPHFDDMLIGHFHNPASIQMGESTLRVAPAVKGPDDYSYAGSRIPVPSGVRLLEVAEGKVQSDRLIELENIGKPMAA